MIILLCGLLLSFKSWSINLEEIKTLAIDNSYSLKAEMMEAKALEQEAVQRGKWQNPQIMGQFGGLKSGSQSGATAEVSFTQSVPLSDKFGIKKQIALEAMEQQKTKSAFFKNWVTHQAVLSAWRVYVYYLLHQHGAERSKRLSLIKKYINNRPRVSPKQKVEANLIESNLLQLEVSQEEKKHLLEVALNDLEFWTTKRIDPKELTVQIPDQWKDVRETEALKSQEIIEAKRSLKLAKLEKELASKERRPDVFLGAGYRIENVNPVNHFSYGIIGINIPIWDTGYERKEAAGARLMREDKLFKEAQRKIDLKLKNQKDLVRYSIDLMKRFPRKLVNTSEEAIKIAEAGFRKQVVDVNTFLSSESQSHEVIDLVYLSWLGYLENISTLQLMQGEDFVWKK